MWVHERVGQTVVVDEMALTVGAKGMPISACQTFQVGDEALSVYCVGDIR